MAQVSHLKSHLGFWMRMVSNQVSQAFARKLEQSGVTVAEWVILREMFEHSDRTSPGHVAKLTGLTKGAISKLIDRLLEKDLVERETDKEDRRGQWIQLTRKARTLVPKLSALADLNDEEFFSDLSQTERRELNRLLRKVADANRLEQLPIS
jgi:DNA-binding MarR family transcriptional regulator